MNRRHGPKRGFTLIELMVVLTIIAVLTPVVFRLYHEGIKNSEDRRAARAAALAGAGILFEHMEQDLRHAYGVEARFADATTNENRLALKIRPPEERRRLLDSSGDLTGAATGGSALIVVYRLDPSGEVVREVYPADASSADAPTHRKALVRDAKRLTFVYNSLSPRQTTLVRVLVESGSKNPYVRPAGPFARVFRVDRN